MIGVGKSKGVLNKDIDINVLNQSFVPSSNSINTFTPLTLSSVNDSDSIVESSFRFSTISAEDVVEGILSIKSKAIGLDEMHPSFLKLLLPVLLPYIIHIFNSIIVTNEFPTQWKMAKIIPVPKTSWEDDFRPISILPFLSKVFEKIIQKQISTFLERENILTSKQSGFRKKNSCITALISVSEDIRKSIDNDDVTFLILLDFSKAFDMVNHSILCEKLSGFYNFSSDAVKLIFSYLTKRTQAVEYKGVLSNFVLNKSGVPQGSILGPLFFSLYINELPKIIKYCSIRLYADDAQLYLSCPLGLIEHFVTCINEDLENILRWSHQNSLMLNPKKSKCLLISKSKIDVSYFPFILLNGAPIEYVESAKNLGVIFNRSLTWKNHVAYIVGKTYGVLRTLWSTQYYTPLNIRTLLVKTLILPLITYGSEIFCSLDHESKRKLTVAFNSAIRYVHGLRRFDSISQHVSHFLGMSFENLLKFRSLVLFSDILLTHQPIDLYNEISFLNSSRSGHLLIPRFSCMTSERQFFVNSTRLWNLLPHQLRSINSMILLKKELKLHFKNI